MTYRAYLKYNPDDFDSKPKISSNSSIELPTITQAYNQPTQPIDLGMKKFQKQYFDNVLELDQVFWKVFLWIALLPLLNSAVSNIYILSKNVFHNTALRSEYKKLNADRSELLGKMKEYHSVSGMKRTIKEEIKALEENEILVKIIDE